jgi:hypothetical protein
MKLGYASILTLFSIITCPALQAAPIIVEAPIEHLFVPNGFDNNDNVEVVVTGNFPNSCYSRNKVETIVKGEVIELTVTALKQEKPGVNCKSVEIPFQENVTIGNLQAGDYKIVVNGKVQDKLSVDVSASTSVDEHLYAMVNYVELGFTGGLSGDAMLVGRSQGQCLELDEVKYLSNGKDTLSVLPIMKKTSAPCIGERSYLEIPIKFNLKAFDYKKTLIFVRTMDGKSVSALVEELH